MKVNITDIALGRDPRFDKEDSVMMDILDDIFRFNVPLENIPYTIASIELTSYLNKTYKNLFEFIERDKIENITNLFDVYITSDKKYFILYRGFIGFEKDGYACIYQREVEQIYSILLYKRVE